MKVKFWHGADRSAGPQEEIGLWCSNRRRGLCTDWSWQAFMSHEVRISIKLFDQDIRRHQLAAEGFPLEAACEIRPFPWKHTNPQGSLEDVVFCQKVCRRMSDSDKAYLKSFCINVDPKLILLVVVTFAVQLLVCMIRLHAPSHTSQTFSFQTTNR